MRAFTGLEMLQTYHEKSIESYTQEMLNAVITIYHVTKGTKISFETL